MQLGLLPSALLSALLSRFSDCAPAFAAAPSSAAPPLQSGGSVWGLRRAFLFTGLIKEPATQQFNTMDPKMRKLPLQPKESKRNWLRGAKVNRMTGLPVMARPFAMGLFTWK